MQMKLLYQGLLKVEENISYNKYMGVKNVVGGTFEDINEAVVKPVVSEVGQMIEAGVKTSMGSNPPDPNEEKKKETDRQKKIAEWRWRLTQQNKLAEAQRKVRDEEKLKQFQQTQVEHQEKQVKDLEVIKKKENLAVRQAQTKTEIRGGVGG